ncbi:MAG: alpha/beta fold hydrolase [Microthrixaceae bacterium]|nr:alpha/beta fold hydrolase [Microthrixaceae bacterium]
MRARRVMGYGVLGTAMVGLAGFVGISMAGSRIRRRHDEALDALLDPPEDVDHRTIPTHDGGELHLIDTGNGRPVLLFHGVTLQWWVWSSAIRLLRDRYRVIAWDMRGHGRSVAGTEGVSLGAAAADVETVLETLDLRDAIIVGHSMGGMVQGRFAVDRPEVLAERVGGMLFLATSAASLSVKGLAGGLAALSTVLERGGRALIRRPQLAYSWGDTDVSAVLVRLAFGRRATARMVDDVRRMLAECTPRTLGEAGTTIAEHDLRRCLGPLPVPTMVVVGDEDRLTPPPHARVLARLVSNAELVELRGIGHQVMQEAPAELVGLIDKLAAARD